MGLVSFIMSVGPMAKSARENDMDKTNYIDFALSSPNYLDDFAHLHTKLQEQKISCIEGPSSLGTYSLMVDIRHFEKARTFSANLVRNEGMTIRLRKDSNSAIFEVYTKGRMTGEASFVVNDFE